MGYATRDSQGGAVKATHVVVNGESRDIFKDPITDDGVKKSAKGYLRVYQDVEGVIMPIMTKLYQQNGGMPQGAEMPQGTEMPQGGMPYGAEMPQQSSPPSDNISVEEVD